MLLQSLYLRNFRNFEEAHLDFSKGVNLFFGQNGQGKTNLLEAIFLTSTGKSFRTRHLQELIQEKKEVLFLEAQIIRSKVIQILKMTLGAKNRILECNKAKYPTFQPLLGLLPSIFFVPHDKDLINGAPMIRRRFMNLHLAQSDPIYVHHLLRYLRSMKYRNFLLKKKLLDGIECWEKEMALSAFYLYQQRFNFFLEIEKELGEICEDLQIETFSVRYQPTFTPENYLEQLKKNRNKEGQFGCTFTGPHRDEVLLFIEKRPAELYASEGQKRGGLLALKIAEWKRFQKNNGTIPLFAIDDFDLHLDPRRQEIFFRKILSTFPQVFISTPNFPSHFGENGKMFEIVSGKIDLFRN